MLRTLKDGWNHATTVETGIMRRGALCALWLGANEATRKIWTIQKEQFQHDNPDSRLIEESNRLHDQRLKDRIKGFGFEGLVILDKANRIITRLFL